MAQSGWIYHERQQANLCGQHALNNLCQAAIFDVQQLQQIARQLDLKEFAMFGPPGSPAYMARAREGSGNVDPTGNFSLQVLQQALASFSTEPIDLPNIVDETVRNVEPTIFEGFICHRESHWFAIRKIHDQYWNLNSFMKKPQMISHFKLATEIANLQNNAYMVFVALPRGWQSGSKLPPICESGSDRSRGKMKYWWNEGLLLKNSTGDGGIDYSNKAGWSYEDPNETEVADPANASQDPWLNAGSGQALGTVKAAPKAGENFVPAEEYQKLEVQEAPTKPDTTTTQLQLKLPHKQTVKRHFNKSDTVAYLYKVVLSLCTVKPVGKHLQLSAGFPPKVLVDGNLTLEQAGVMKASVGCRWL